MDGGTFIMEKYLLAIDQGTTSTRAIIFNKQGQIIYQAQEEIEQFYPQIGWVEQDATEIYSKTLSVMIEAVVRSRLEMDQIACIGITNQRETIVMWDKKTQEPVYKAIVWQSNQSEKICQRLIKKGYEKKIQDKTGLKINPYFSATKIMWLFEKYPHLKKKAKDGELLCGTIDSWLLYKLTNGNVHATDISNASRTMLFNIHTLKWDKELLTLFSIPETILPEVKPSSGIFGYIEKNQFLNNQKRIPISGMAGDQQASLFGHCCFQPGELKNTYGTGCFALINTGNKPVRSKKGLLTTIAWQIQDEICYALEGSVFVAGAAVQWLRDGLRMIQTSKDSERYAKKVCDSQGVYVVPSFTGLGTPYWNNQVKGAIFGLTRGTTKEHIIRATLESIAYQSKDVIETMKKETKLCFSQLAVDGGASENDFLMQFQSDILQCEIILQENAQSTALGVAFLAGLGSGLYRDLKEIKQLKSIKKMYQPEMSAKEVRQRYAKWKVAISAVTRFV